ncbi:MAG TPA: hypothetical protein VIC06_14880 [Solirubrobacteraceae bacterium]
MVRLVLAGQGLARVVLVSLCVVVCGAVVGVAPALAVVSRFGNGEGPGAGQFREPHGVTVEQESGDVYVADKENERVDKFGPGGEFLFAWGWGVADGHTEALQRCTSVCFTGVYGGGSGELRFPEGVAVDNDPLSASHGDVYVVDAGNSRVQKFDSAGNFLLMFGGEVNATTKGNVCLAGEACQAGVEGSGPGQFVGSRGDRIAVDSSGTVFVGDANRVQEFSPEGVYEGQIAIPGAGEVIALAVDSSGDVYVEGRELGGVHEYNGAGVELGEPRDPSSHPYSGNAIAVGPSDELFIDSGEGSHRLLQFDPAGGEVASFDAGPEPGNRGIAFGNGIGGLYVLEAGAVRLVSPPPAGPLVPAGSESAGELQPTAATVNATVNPEGHETSYSFEYGTSEAYGASTTPVALTGESFEDQPASAALSELQPRTLYHFRVVATDNASPTPHTTFGPDETFTTLPPVLIDSESVSGVTARSATLAAQLNPLGRDTRFRFEYGSTTAYGTSVPVPDGDAGAGTADVALSALVEGLSPGTVYHYRVVAYNSLDAPGTVVEGSDRTFTTQAGEAPGLLDGRAWELVSPPDKHGAALEALGVSQAAGGALIQAARGGGAVTYVANGPVDPNPAGNRNVEFTQVLAARGVGGWSSRGIATPLEPPVVGFVAQSTSEYRWFSDDLSVGLVEPAGVTPLSPAASERTIYRREADGEYTPLVDAANVPPGTEFGKSPEEVHFVGANPDLSHAVLSSKRALTPGFLSGGLSSVYEWAGGSLRLVSVLPGSGKPAAEEGEGALVGTDQNNARHAVSDDGSRIVWSTLNSGGEVHLYVTDMGLGRSVQLDVVGEGAQGGSGEPVFQTASGDGSKVFFTDGSRLTADATSDQVKPDLYMCEVGVAAGKPTCRLKDLTADEHAGEAADVQGVAMGAGEDGRYVYFVANGALAPGAAPGNCNGEAHTGMCNLYVVDTVTGERKLVAALSGEDHNDWVAEGPGGTTGLLVRLSSRVSPNGRYLTFMSERSLTGYDNIDVHSGQADEEVFVYDVGTGRVVCASCNPSGARPSGVFDPGASRTLLVDRPGAWEGRWLAASIPGLTNASGNSAWYQSRYLSDSGRLFFNAADALVGRDTNGREDVYEYEPGGVGGCARPAGCVGLISSGTSGVESAFMDASESGDEVFFLTASQLVGQDVDGALDLYDARVCSVASPCLGSPPAVVAPACSSSESCRGIAPGQPQAFASPSSMSASGGGNLVPPAGGPVVRGRGLSRAQKLAGALRVCRRKPVRVRALCRARARRLYGSGVRAKRAGSAGASRKGKG